VRGYGLMNPFEILGTPYYRVNLLCFKIKRQLKFCFKTDLDKYTNQVTMN